MKRCGWIGLGVLALILALVSNAGGAAIDASPAPSPTSTRVAPPTLTPSPQPTTPVVIPSVTTTAHSGATIWLRVQVESPIPETQWTSLWTVVQWQDALGDWHDVDGWRGSLDEVAKSEGRKVWWLPETLAGRGPFRWLVYAQPGGTLLATSPVFYLPGPAGRVEVVTVALTF